MLRVRELGYQINHRNLFRNLTFELQPGHCLHVSGPNGSGKTTLLKILSGLLMPSEGCFQWKGRGIKGHDVGYVQDFHYIGQLPSLYSTLTVAENLKYSAALKTVEAPSSECSFNLDAYLNSPFLKNWNHSYAAAFLKCEALSSGQAQRLRLAMLEGLKKTLRILDEPLNSLDVEAEHHFLDILKRHLSEGGLAVIASHISFSSKVQGNDQSAIFQTKVIQLDLEHLV